jgi:ABC-2 type transport system ATP-binding protein
MTAIEVEGLSKRFGPKVAVDDVSFTVAEGEIFGLLGRNGAGKSTTVDCLAGLRVPDHGRIRVAGLDPRQVRREVRQLLGVQLQESQLPDRLTVAEAMRLYASFHPRAADIDGLLAQLDLTDKLNTRYRRLSGGQKQRLSIALALIGRPRIAILDELTTGLDPVARRDTWQLIDDIRNQGVTIVLVTHFMDEAARLCDRAAIMRDGRDGAVLPVDVLRRAVDPAVVPGHAAHRAVHPAGRWLARCWPSGSSAGSRSMAALPVEPAASPSRLDSAAHRSRSSGGSSGVNGRSSAAKCAAIMSR